MKVILKVVGVGLIFYALTLATNEKVVKAVKVEVDSLSFYYKMSEGERKAMEEDRAFERMKKGGNGNEK